MTIKGKRSLSCCRVAVPALSRCPSERDSVTSVSPERKMLFKQTGFLPFWFSVIREKHFAYYNAYWCKTRCLSLGFTVKGQSL